MPSCHMLQYLMKHSTLKLINNCILEEEPQEHFVSMPYPKGAKQTHSKPYLVYILYLQPSFLKLKPLLHSRTQYVFQSIQARPMH